MPARVRHDESELVGERLSLTSYILLKRVRLSLCGLTLGEADKQIGKYEGAGNNSYRSSVLRALAGLAAYPWALSALGRRRGSPC
jgi:hypothetical protein